MLVKGIARRDSRSGALIAQEIFKLKIKQSVCGSSCVMGGNRARLNYGNYYYQ